MAAYQISVVITQDEDGMYMAQVPNLPGCHTQAKTLATLYKRIQEAAELCLEVEKKKKNVVLKEKFVGLQQLEVTV
jgi:predicted RNase H-like HicB family nuclease